MSKSCFDGYITPSCPICSDWANGTDSRGLGCACCYPISDCSHFAKMRAEESMKKG